MARLRRDTQESASPAIQRPLRVVASGTLFLTHTLSLPTHPEPSSVVRARSVTRSRGGSASTCLAILAQFPSVEAMLVAPLGGNDDGRMIIRDLEKERVSTRFCKIWNDAGVPSAWVLYADDTDSRTVINNNPLPDITHEEFIALLGPLLAPENYAYLAPPSSSSSPAYTHPFAPTPAAAPPATLSAHPHTIPPRASFSHPSGASGNSANTNNGGASAGVRSPAPFDWIHFEGRSVKTTLSNIVGLDGLARERKWRSHCVFSVDVGRRARQGVEALIPHADVLFLNKHYALAHSPQYAASPRASLLAFTALAPPHALLVAHWGTDGAAVLSVPTREYFQSSGWVPSADAPPPPGTRMGGSAGRAAGRDIAARTADDGARLADNADVRSVRTASDFWAGEHSDSTSVFTAGALSSCAPSLPPSTQAQHAASSTRRREPEPRRSADDDVDSDDSDGTQVAPGRSGASGVAHGSGGGGGYPQRIAGPNGTCVATTSGEVLDEVGAQDAFVAGMMFALSRRLLPGEPYTPAAVRDEPTASDGERERGRWRLEECLRFATELAGRKAWRKGWDGLADEMTSAGWFES
ncbi:hypothetical protein AcW1_003031 [Taiwanofungus camphoratus]|nr:hypothetical protein AcW1_003031 [Antrodia cinnamomea]